MATKMKFSLNVVGLCVMVSIYIPIVFGEKETYNPMYSNLNEVCSPRMGDCHNHTDCCNYPQMRFYQKCINGVCNCRSPGITHTKVERHLDVCCTSGRRPGLMHRENGIVKYNSREDRVCPLSKFGDVCWDQFHCWSGLVCSGIPTEIVAKAALEMLSMPLKVCALI